MIEVKNAHGDTVRRSRNLRAIGEHTRQHVVMEVHISRSLDGSARLCVIFRNGDFCATTFADWRVLVGWCLRRRSFWGAAFWVNGRRSGFVNARHSLRTIAA